MKVVYSSTNAISNLRPLLGLLLLSALLLAILHNVTAFAEDGVHQRNVEVFSDRVEYSATGTITFSGNVIVQIDSISVQALTLKVERQEAGNIYNAIGNPISISCQDCASLTLHAEIGKAFHYDARTNEIKLSGGILIHSEDKQNQIQAASASWQGNDNVLVLTGNPRLRWRRQPQEAFLEAQAQHIHYYASSGSVIFTGDATIKQGNSNVSGNRIQFNIATGDLLAESTGEKRVKATFDSNE